MGQYVSPFGNGASSGSSGGGKPRNTDYISPFEGSVYTEDYWKKKRQEDQTKQQESDRKRQIQENIEKGDAESKRLQEEVWKPSNILKDIVGAAGNFTAAVNEKVLGGATKAAVKAYNTITTGFNQEEANKRTDDFLKKTGQVNDRGEAALASGKGINRESRSFKIGEATGDVVKGLTVDVPVEAYKAGRNVVNQARISSEMGLDRPNLDQANADKLKKFIDEDEKAGLLTKAQADEKRNKLKTEVEKTSEAIKRGEEKTGTKYDQTSGTVSLLETAANVAGLGGVGRKVLEKTAEAATKRLGRELTEEEAKNLAEQTKKVLPEDAPQPVTATEAKPITASVANSELPTSPEAQPVGSLPIEDTLLTAAKTKAEERLGRELNSQEVEGLTQQTKQLVAEKFPAPVDTPSATEAPLTTPELVKAETPPTIKPPEGDTVSGNAARIESVALEKKLTEKMGDLPQYRAINMKEQAEEAVNLISTDKQKAIDIIEGKANAPGNLKAQSVHQALEDLAVREGDGELLTKLAKSNVNTELSESAQNLRIAAERDPHSPVEQIRQVRDARRKAAERRSKTTISKEVQDIKKKAQAATPKVKKETWASFVKGLEC